MNLELISKPQQELQVLFNENYKAIVKNIFGTDDIESLMSVVITNDQVKEYKNLLALANKEVDKYETERKEISKAINAQFKEFEKVYKAEFKGPIDEVVEYFKNQIKDIENEELELKASKLRLFLEVLTKDTVLENVTLEKLGITFTKSVSDKKIQEQIENEVTRILNDYNLIETLPNKKFVKYEYEKDFNLTRAIGEANKLSASVENEVEEPKKEVEESFEEEEFEEDMTVTLEITSNKAKIKALKAFLEQERISYQVVA